MFRSGEEHDDTIQQFKTPPTGTTQMALEHLNREIQSLKQIVSKNEKKVNNEILEVKGRIESTEEKLVQTSTRVEYLETAVEEEHTLNVAAFADQTERQDFNSNQAKSHCVLITGN
jgi:predicted  nucleic acid-binding Zn-ribbon protein